MSEPVYPFSCSCGRKFLLKDRHLGISVLCPDCSGRLEVPSDLKAAKRTAKSGAGSRTPHAQPPAQDAGKPNVLVTYLLPGIGLLIAGVVLLVLFFVMLNRGGIRGRGMITMPAVGGVMVLIGGGMLLKGLLGDRIEWD